MRVGFYVSNLIPEAGGAFAFERTIITDLASSTSEHELFFFTYRPQQYFHTTQHKVIPLKTPSRLERIFFEVSEFALGPFVKRSKKLHRLFLWSGLIGHGTPLTVAAKREKIDFMWFLGGYEETNLPFAMTVFDLQHRNQSEFPEVRAEGWLWEDREEFYNKSIKKASFVIVGTEEGKKEVLRAYGVNPNRIHVIPLPLTKRACEEDETRPISLSKLQDKTFIFYPSQFWPHKNHVTVLLAIKKLIDEHGLNLSVVFCGSDMGNRDYIYRYTRELGLESSIHLLHYVSDSELRWLYRHSLALVFPTFFGPDNLPPIEAFALGCPVIASNVPGAHEQLGDAALLFNPTNEDELCNLIVKLHSSSDLRQKLIERGGKIAAQRTSQLYVSKILKVLDFASHLRRAWSSSHFTSIASNALFWLEM